MQNECTEIIACHDRSDVNDSQWLVAPPVLHALELHDPQPEG